MTATALAPGVTARVTFTDLLANGQGVGRVRGMVVFADGVLPGETAIVRIAQVKPRYAVGTVLTIETRSELRAQPFCPVFGQCGGCQVQHLAYPAQLAWKGQLVRNALRRIGGFKDVVVNDPVGMPFPRHYRNKMALVVQNRGIGSRPVLGFYRARSHALVAIDGCPIVLPALDAAIKGLAAAANDGETAIAIGETRHAIARHAAATGETVLSLTTERRSAAIARAAPALAQRVPGTIGVSNSFEPRSANNVLGRKVAYVWGRREMEDVIEGVRFRVSPASFFQVNGEMVGAIFRALAPAVGAGRRIVDLYCGAGTFAIFFASRGATVVGIEENPAAVAEARVNAELNGVGERATFVEGRVEGALANEDGKRALHEAEIVFLDPPRKGSDDATLDAIAAAGVPHVWYLSCNPATLARDLQRLAVAGYALGIVQPFDMFPQTGHVETLVTLHRTAAPPAVEPQRPPTEWDERIPVWPSDDPYARHEYPAFVERPASDDSSGTGED